ncbi:MAG: hypothetical protein N3G80_04290 [Candidatus Micrarchaeota archaeon]|nr:hypothetical protein [Candidatus Micrarchaeota archaeon]
MHDASFKKGVFTFLLASIFLFALLAASALALEAKKPDKAFQKYHLLRVQELAVRTAIMESVSASAQKALYAAIALDQEPYFYIKGAVHEKLVQLEEEFRKEGFDVVIWCGFPSAKQLADASKEMQKAGKALSPASTVQVSAGSCLHSIHVGLAERKVQLSSFGFSLYSEPLGAGVAFKMPPNAEVDF